MEKFIKKLEFYMDRMDVCPVCNTKALEIYDYWNNALGYSRIIDSYMRGEKLSEGALNKKAFFTIRCKRCGKCFPIRWEFGYPLPDSNPLNFQGFMKSFKDQNRK